MTYLGARLNIGRTLINAPLVGHLATPCSIGATAALAVRLLAAQVQVQASIGLFIPINVAVNLLMADVQQACYLLGAVLQAQVIIHAMPHFERRQARVTGALSAPAGSLLGKLGVVASAAFVACDFPINSAYAVANDLRNSAIAFGQPDLDLVSCV